MNKKSTKLLQVSGKCPIFASLYILKQATESPNANAAGIFYVTAESDKTISSVPCGALMRPLPVSRCRATGSGTFLIPRCKNSYLSNH